MARVTFDAKQAAKLERTRQVLLGTEHEVHVRLIPASKVYEFEAAREAPLEEQTLRVLAILLCDADGKPTYGSWGSKAFKELSAWPVGYLATALAQGMDLNGMGDEDDESPN